jgi:hypothetical protein
MPHASHGHNARDSVPPKQPDGRRNMYHMGPPVTREPVDRAGMLVTLGDGGQDRGRVRHFRDVWRVSHQSRCKCVLGHFAARSLRQ